MRRFARRLDDEAAKIEVTRQFSRRDPLFEQARDARLEVGENVHYPDLGEASQKNRRYASAGLYRKSKAASKSRACSAIANRSVMPAI